MDEAGISMDEFKQAFEKGNMFASGIGRAPRAFAGLTDHFPSCELRIERNCGQGSRI